jgi:hypothetical protein
VQHPSRTRRTFAPGVLAALIALVLGTAASLAALAKGAAADAPAGPTVTVSQATDLVDQRIKVTWSGFVDNTYALDIFQCRGTQPSGPADCDGVNYAGTPHAIVDSAALYGVTGSSGSAWLEVRPRSERPSLGCDDSTPCNVTVVVKPAIGATKENFSAMPQSAAGAARVTDLDFQLAASAGQIASTPIRFAPEGDTCPSRTLALRVAGNSEHTTAGLSWLGALCRSTRNPMTMAVSASSGPEGRAAFLAGAVDAAITTQPLGGPLDTAVGNPDSGPDRGPGDVVYAPLENSAIVLAFNIDDADGHEITGLKLSPRLVAKILTDAYHGDRDNGIPVPRFGLLSDPELRALNPGIAWPAGDGRAPLIRGVSDDTIWELTRWLAADPAAKKWLEGEPDENGVLCPPNWRLGTLAYPFALVINRTASDAPNYRPISSYWELIRRVAKANHPARMGDGQFEREVDPDTLGRRNVIGFMDSEAAARLQLPTAQLRNAAGAFVAPTPASVTAGIKAAKPGPDGVTLSNDFASTDPAAYPLTKTDVAIIPTKGLTTPVASSFDTYLAYAAGPGQKPGPLLGQLPSGYAPLTDAQKQQVEAARTAVRKAAEAPPTTPPTGGTTTAGSDHVASGGGSSSGGGADGGGTPPDTSGGNPPTSAAPSPATSPKTAPVASANDKKSSATLPAAVAERLKEALHGDPSAILLVVLMAIAIGSAGASPVLLALGWHRRTGRWPPPLPALNRAFCVLLRRPTGAAR